MTTLPSQCEFCARLRPRDDLDAPRTCDAFPNAIPAAVFDGDLDHRQPIPGDGGLQWSSRTGAPFPEYVLPPRITP